jgi:hypothetical protein
MNSKLLASDVQKFIKNFTGDLAALLLKKPQFKNLSNKELAVQIQTYQLAKKKIPAFKYRNDIIYPPKIHLEQSSSEQTAKFKAQLLQKGRGVDLTGGFGLDAYYLAQTNENVIYTDADQELSSIVDHNFKNLSVNNIQVYDLPADIMLDQLPMQLDWFFIDPSRRSNNNSKIITLEDSQPDILGLQQKLKAKFHHGLIKASPMLSIEKALRQIDQVENVHIVAMNNDVKELLFQVNYTQEVKATKINSYDLSNETNLIYQKEYSNKISFQIQYSDVKDFLYIPHPAISKAGFFYDLAVDFSVDKIAQATHLYTSKDKLDFPGRCFKVLQIFEYKPKKLKKLFFNENYHIITKNFGIKSDHITTTWSLQPKGNKYLIAFKDKSGKRLVAKTELFR